MPKVVKDYAPLLAVDVETDGLDTHHGASVYYITTCDDNDEQQFWEFDVDPLTRKVRYNHNDLAQFRVLVKRHERQGGRFVGQNFKFDCHCLANLPKWNIDWPWHMTDDTIISGHLLSSNTPHDLTSMALVYLGINIQPFEDAVKKATQECRRIARKKYPEWRIAKKGLAELPSAKEECWKYDMWLPRAIALEENYPNDHPYFRVLQEYANPDSFITVNLFKVHRDLLKEQGLWEIYQERMKVLPVAWGMEEYGLTLNHTRHTELMDEFKEESERSARICINIAKGYGYDLELPKSGNNKSLAEFVFGEDKLNLPHLKTSKKTGIPALDKEVLGEYRKSLPHNSKQLTFIKHLENKRQRDTYMNYLSLYERFALPAGYVEGEEYGDEWWRVHPSLNPTATDTLRWGSNNPSSQTVKKGDRSQGEVSLRYAFGPPPGYEWWSLDYQNIELRIPAYESGEEVMIEIFEKPDEPPYFGSYHLLNASIIYPDLFWPLAEQKGAFKKKYAATWYQWAKNFGFAFLYGAVPESGTADRAAHKKGAHMMVIDRLKKHTALNQYWIDFANKHGYVETLPDKEVCPSRGYPLQCSKSSWGKVSPTVPLNYHVQSSACWVASRALVKVADYLKTKTECRIINYVHDELVLELPRRKNSMGNLPIIRNVKKIMESLGDCINVPLTCGVDYHQHNWAEGIAVNA